MRASWLLCSVVDVDVLGASLLSVVSSVVLRFVVRCGFRPSCWFCHASDSLLWILYSFVPPLFLLVFVLGWLVVFRPEFWFSPISVIEFCYLCRFDG